MSSASEIVAWAALHATEDDEWDAEFARQSTFIRGSEVPASFVLYSTKLNPILRAFEHELPPDMVLVQRFWPTPHWSASVVRALASTNGQRIRFVGDLDPIDLLTYCSLSQSLSSSVKVDYIGVRSEWVSGGRAKGMCTMQLSSFERALWQQMQGLTDWRTLLGAESCALVDGGDKLELDGVLNPDLQDAATLERLCDELRRG